MPIDTPHPEYTANIAAWTLCRDVYGGEEAVKARGVIYLPRIDKDQDGEKYSAYKQRAGFHDGYARTVDGCVGAIARRPHTVDLPRAMECFVGDADAGGISLNEIIKAAATEILVPGRGGILVDYDERIGRAYLSIYQAEAITNWGGEAGLVLHETIYEPDPADLFKLKAIEQYRQLRLRDGTYTVTIWRKSDAPTAGSGWVQHGDEGGGLIRGRPMEEIPFFFLSFHGQTSKISKPPLLGLANTALNYYCLAADLAHGRHFTALPTLVISGQGEEGALRVGAGAVIYLNDANAKAYYAEFTGAGLGSLETGIAETSAKMALLGASALGQLNAAETATAARIRASGETNTLAATVDAVEATLNAALRCAAKWMSCTDEPVVRLNREFFPTPLDPALLREMVAALDAKAVTAETFGQMIAQHGMAPGGQEAGG